MIAKFLVSSMSFLMDEFASSWKKLSQCCCRSKNNQDVLRKQQEDPDKLRIESTADMRKVNGKLVYCDAWWEECNRGKKLGAPLVMG